MELKRVIIFLVALIGPRVVGGNDVLQQWNEFIAEYEKSYKSPEEAIRRFGIFRENLAEIIEHNKLYKQGLRTYEQGVNSFTDLTYEEAIESIAVDDDSEDIPIEKGMEVEIEDYPPNSIDWRTRGAVTGVKNQRKCSSCYAFAVTGAVEGQLAIIEDDHAVLSEQNIVDCAGMDYDCRGCKSGSSKGAFRYIAENGITTAEEYPYTAKVGQCKRIETPKYFIRGFFHVRKNEEHIKKLVGLKGPATTTRYKVSKGLFGYKSGVYYEEVCISRKRRRHSSLIVGYGTENETDYWLVKNSWGEKWGDSGYFKIARNKENFCDIGNNVYVPRLYEYKNRSEPITNY